MQVGNATKNRWLVPILCLGTFGILCTETGIIGILPQVAKHFNVSIIEAGLLVSMFALAVAVAGATLPAALSKMNRKAMMLMVLGAFALGNVVFAFAPNFTVALIARVLPAFVHPVYCSAAYTLAERSVAPEDAPKASAKVMMGVSGGLVVGVPLASIVASAASFSAVMLMFAAINLATFLATVLLVPSMPVAEKQGYLKQVSALKSSVAIISLLATACIQAAIFAVYAYAAEFVGEVGDIAGEAQSAVLLGFGVASLLGNYLAGRFLSRAARATLAVFPLAVCATYGLLVAGGASAPLFAAAVALWGVVYGFGNNVQQFVTSTSMPTAPDFANGMFISFGNIGITVGTTIGGLFLASGGASACVLPALAISAISWLLLIFRNRLMSKEGGNGAANLAAGVCMEEA